MLKKMEASLIISLIIPFFKKNRFFLISVIICLVLYDAFFVSISSDLIIFTLIAFYVLISLLFKNRSRLTFSLCLVFLFILFLEYIKSGVSEKSEKIAVWLVIFIAVGVIQQWKKIYE